MTDVSENKGSQGSRIVTPCLETAAFDIMEALHSPGSFLYRCLACCLLEDFHIHVLQGEGAWCNSAFPSPPRTVWSWSHIFSKNQQWWSWSSKRGNWHLGFRKRQLSCGGIGTKEVNQRQSSRGTGATNWTSWLPTQYSSVVHITNCPLKSAP